MTPPPQALAAHDYERNAWASVLAGGGGGSGLLSVVCEPLLSNSNAVFGPPKPGACGKRADLLATDAQGLVTFFDAMLCSGTRSWTR